MRDFLRWVLGWKSSVPQTGPDQPVPDVLVRRAPAGAEGTLRRSAGVADGTFRRAPSEADTPIRRWL